MQSGLATGFLCEQWLSAKVGRQFLSRDFLPSDTWAEAPRAPPPPARAAYIEPVLYTPFGFSDADAKVDPAAAAAEWGWPEGGMAAAGPSPPPHPGLEPILPPGRLPPSRAALSPRAFRSSTS